MTEPALDELRLQLGYGLSCSGAVRDRLFCLFEFSASNFIKIAILIVIKKRRQFISLLKPTATRNNALFSETRFEALAPSA